MEQIQDNGQQAQIHYVYVEKKDGCFTGCLKLGCGFFIALLIIGSLIGCEMLSK